MIEELDEIMEEDELTVDEKTKNQVYTIISDIDHCCTWIKSKMTFIVHAKSPNTLTFVYNSKHSKKYKLKHFTYDFNMTKKHIKGLIDFQFNPPSHFAATTLENPSEKASHILTIIGNQYY